MPPKPVARKPLIPRFCPDCGEENSIVLDEYEGIIVCNECGIVLKGGLEESEESAFHDDQVRSRDQQQILYGSGDNANNNNNSKNKKGANASSDDYLDEVVPYIASLKTRLDTPDGVAAEAKALLNDFLPELPEDQPRPQPVALAIALFHIASLLQHYPLSLKQCDTQLRSTTPTRDLVKVIVDKLKIQLPAPERILGDHVQVLLAKLRYQPLEPMTTMASAMASTFDKVISSYFEPRVVAAVSIFLCSWAKSCREKIAPRVCAVLNEKKGTAEQGGVMVMIPAEKVWTQEEKTHFEKKLAALIGDEEGLLRSCVNHLSSKKEFVPQWVAEAAAKFPEVKLPQEGGQRRERE